MENVRLDKRLIILFLANREISLEHLFEETLVIEVDKEFFKISTKVSIFLFYQNFPRNNEKARIWYRQSALENQVLDNVGLKML